MSHILLVEDSPTQAAAIQHELEAAGHTVRFVTRAVEVIDACLSAVPDLLIVDLYLDGGASGFDLCRQIKMHLSLQTLPLLVLTSSVEHEDHLSAIEAGADRFLSKSATPDQILATVDSLVRISPPIQAIEADAHRDHDFIRGSRLLVVDDSQPWLELLVPRLQEAGFQTETARSGEAALQMLARRSFDVCTIDLLMGRMDGLEMCRRARELAAKKQTLLGLLMVTGQEDRQVWVQALEAGADDFVSKESDIDIIVAHARAVARRVRMTRLVQTTTEKAHLQEMARQQTDWALRKTREQTRQGEELAGSREDLQRTVRELRESNRRLELVNQELREFAYVASHDLQEPLRKIGSYANLLQRRYTEQLDERGQRWLNYTVDGATRLQTLIRNLLEYTRVDTRARSPAEFDSGLAVQQAITDLQSEIEASRAEVNFDELPRMAANKDQFVQVIRELVRNSIQFNVSDRPDVRVSASRHETGWHFSVTDNGIGIEPAYFDQIFEIFKRLHPQDEYPGTGIGLSLCRKIIRLHDGRIWPESVPGQGTTMHFTIPAAVGETGP